TESHRFFISSLRDALPILSGVKNSGKTTLIESVLPLLSQAGLNVAVVKHDGHSFLPDPPGTDTGRFMAAGAAGTAIFDGEKFKRSEEHTSELQSRFELVCR